MVIIWYVSIQKLCLALSVSGVTLPQVCIPTRLTKIKLKLYTRCSQLSCIDNLIHTRSLILNCENSWVPRHYKNCNPKQEGNEPTLSAKQKKMLYCDAEKWYCMWNFSMIYLEMLFRRNKYSGCKFGHKSSKRHSCSYPCRKSLQSIFPSQSHSFLSSSFTDSSLGLLTVGYQVQAGGVSP